MAEELKPCPFCGGAVRFHSDEDCHGCHYIECGGCKAMFDFSPTTDPENQCDSLHELQCGIARAWNTRATRPAPASAGGVEAERITVVSITGNIQAVAAADYDSLKAERDRLQEELADLHNASSAPTEKVEVVGYAGFHQLELRRLLPQYPGMKVKKEPGERYTEPLMTVTQHQRILAASAGSAQPDGWHTEDQLTDKSATTYDPEVAKRWRAKGWPVTPLYTHPADQVAEIAKLRELLTAWRRMFDGGICSGPLGTLCDQTDAALAKPST